VVIKEYFPNEIVSRDGQTVAPFGTTGQDDFERGMQRFVEEGRALARFNHPAVVRILKYFQQNNTAYLVMEFIDGEPLDQYLKRKGTLTPEVVEHLASELLDGLAIVHQHGLIHRDIKPANIMLRPGGTPVLIDFGAAKDALAEKSHSVVVTAGYGALEQYSSKSQLTPATDLYALGGTLYKCLTGKTPEEATSRVIDDEHSPISQLRIAKDCSPGLVGLIDQCMQIKQKDRPAHAKDAKLTLDKPSQQNITQKDYSVLAFMIEMAGFDGVITQKETKLILQKANQLQIHIDEARSLIREITQQNNWKIESEATQGQSMQPPLQTNLIAYRYIDNQDGTVTDIKTNLIWMRCSLGQTWNGHACVGQPERYTWKEVMNQAKQTTYAGSFDWRVPTIEELRSIVDANKNPVICSEAFPTTAPRFYWTASPHENFSNLAWVVYFSDGSYYTSYRDNIGSVRLVRSGQ
jgi:serine/threonine protein kinase